MLLDQNAAPQFWPPNWRLLFGTDSLGVPILAYTLEGFRPALEIGLLGSLLATTVGVVIGSAAGYLGRFVDVVLMRLADAFAGIPMLALIMLVIVSLSERPVQTYVILFAVAGWPSVARLARASVLGLRDTEFVMAARALGASDIRIIFRHILMNFSGVVIVAFTLNAALFMVAEASLDFLGLGPDVITWGGALASAYYSLAIIGGEWWEWLFPACGLFATVLSFNFVGDGLSDAVDVTRWTVRGRASAAEDIGTDNIPDRPSAGGPHIQLSPSVTPEPVFSLRALGTGEPVRQRQASHSAPPLRQTRTWVGRMPKGWAVVPLLILLLSLQAILLYTHSPLDYAPNFSSAQPLAIEPVSGAYDAVPRTRGGWWILTVDQQRQVVESGVDAAGRRIERKIVEIAAVRSGLSLASMGDGLAVAWLARGSHGVDLRVADLTAPHPWSFTVARGEVSSPDLVGSSNGRVFVVFRRRVARGYEIDAATIHVGARSVVTQQVVLEHQYLLYPRAAVSRAGLIIVFLKRCCGTSTWAVMWARVRSGSSVPVVSHRLTVVHYAPQDAEGRNLLQAIPSRWGVSVIPTTSGEVVAGWCGDDGVDVVRFGTSGHPSPVEPATVGACTTELGLAAVHHDVEVFAAFHPLEGGWIGAARITMPGAPSANLARVNFDPGDDAADLRAGSRHGAPAVIWRSGNSLETSTYRRYMPPDLATHLGLNIGSVWANAALEVIGAIVGGFVLVALNAALVFTLSLAWLPARRLVSPTARWIVFLVLIGAGLLSLIAIPPTAPPIVLVLGDLIAPLDAPSRWLVALGAVVTAVWAIIAVFRDQEDVLRAAGAAFTSVWLVCALYAALALQFQITRI